MVGEDVVRLIADEKPEMVFLPALQPLPLLKNRAAIMAKQMVFPPPVGKTPSWRMWPAWKPRATPLMNSDW